MDFLKGFKTVLGVLLLFIPALGEVFQVYPIEQLPHWLDATLTVVGALLALYGRAVAGNTPIFNLGGGYNR